MKSEARLGDSAPSTSTPSTGVGSQLGRVAGVGVGRAHGTNLGEATDRRAVRRAPYAPIREGRVG